MPDTKIIPAPSKARPEGEVATLDYRSRMGVPGAADKAPGAHTRGHKLAEGIKTMIWVIPLTILIWVWAEREQLATQNDLPVQIEVQATSPDRIVTLLSDRPEVTLDLSGPRASLDLIRDRVSTLKPLLLPISEQAPFEGEVNVADRIARANDIFSKNAVTVIKARPNLKVRVERRIERQNVPILIRPEDNPGGKIAFEPGAVTVSGPVSLLKDKSIDQIPVYADVARFKDFKPGTYTESVTVWSSLSDSTPVPSKVKATVIVEGSLASEFVPSMPLFISVPANTLKEDKTKVTIVGDVIGVQNVRISGSHELVEKTKSGDLPSRVIVTLMDWTRRGDVNITLKAENYQVPQGITVLNPEREITVHLSTRE